MNKFNVVSKAIGVVATGAMLYDAGHSAVHSSHKAQTCCTANRVTDAYVNTNYTEKESAVTNKLKKHFFKWQIDDNIPEFFAGIKGLVGGFFSNLTGNVIPLALATGTLLSKKLPGRLCGVGLLACGAKFLATDVMGIGKPKPLGDKV